MPEMHIEIHTQCFGSKFNRNSSMSAKNDEVLNNRMCTMLQQDCQITRMLKSCYYFNRSKLI